MGSPPTLSSVARQRSASVVPSDTCPDELVLLCATQDELDGPLPPPSPRTAASKGKRPRCNGVASYIDRRVVRLLAWWS